MYLIIEEGIPVGFFNDRLKRDIAFKTYFLDMYRNGYVTER